jgi:hypothetical protein
VNRGKRGTVPLLDKCANRFYIGPRKSCDLPGTPCRIDSPRRRQLEWPEGR